MSNEHTKTNDANGGRKVSPINALKNIVDNKAIRKMFEDALHENASTFLASIIEMCNSDPKLLQCDPKAVVMECLKAAVLHLELSRFLGYAYVIPYNNNVKVVDEQGHEHWQKVMTPTFQIGYKGLTQLALRTGQYRFINTDVLYEGELTRFDKLTGSIVINSANKVSDKVVGYFAYIELVSGFQKTIYMSLDDMANHAYRYSKGLNKQIGIEDLKALAQLPSVSNGTTVGWKGNFNAMAQKTVLRILLSRYGYLTTEMARAISMDMESEYGNAKTEAEAKPSVKTLTVDAATFKEAEEVETANGKDGGTAPTPTASDNIPLPNY